jgi:hypothetical protein
MAGGEEDRGHEHDGHDHEEQRRREEEQHREESPFHDGIGQSDRVLTRAASAHYENYLQRILSQT